MNLAALIIIVFWSGMQDVDHPAPADLEQACITANGPLAPCEFAQGCRVTFMAYSDVTEARRSGYASVDAISSPYAMHHLATVTCGNIRSEFDVWQDGRKLEVKPKVQR